MIETYIIPAGRWGWLAVAEEPTHASKWFLPPRHKVWRPTRNMAINAVPKAVARLGRDVASRERGIAADAQRQARREPVGRSEDAAPDSPEVA